VGVMGKGTLKRRWAICHWMCECMRRNCSMTTRRYCARIR
jgi:hypothetical protein